MQRLMSVLLVVVAACGDAADGGPSNLADASASADAPTGVSDSAVQTGLRLDWGDLPPLPGPLSATVTVTSVKLHVDRLEVLGDGGSVPQTTREDVALEWSMTASPSVIYMDDAPPAIYSKVRIGLDKVMANNGPSIEILGTTTANGSAEMFKITTTRKIDLEVTGYNITLGVGSPRTITVMVGLDAGLENVDWAALPVPNSVRTLDDSTANMDAMTAFIDDLALVFTAP